MESQIAADKVPVCGVRYVQTIFLFSCLTCNQIARQSISVSIVAMTNATAANPDFQQYDWTAVQKSYVLGSFYWSYIVMSLPSGLIVSCLGTKKVLFGVTLSTCVTSMLTPYMVKLGGWQLLTAVRALQGFFSCFLPTSVMQHLAKWSPKPERNRMGSLTFAGSDMGNIFAVAIGAIASSKLGWPGIYYVSSLLCGIWTLLWFFFGASSPKTSRFISSAERTYIEATTKPIEPVGQKEQRPPIPWCALISSVPLWATIVARVPQNWLMGISQQQIPTYMNNIMGLNIRTNALLSAIPYLLMFFCSLLCMCLAEFIRHKNLLSLRNLRRLYQTVATVLPSVGCVTIGFLQHGHTPIAVACLIAMIPGQSPHVIGSLINFIDLSSNYTSLMMAFNTLACSATLSLAPLVVGLIVEDVTNRHQWQIIFLLTASLLCISNLFYVIFMSVEVQPWDDLEYKTKNSNKAN